MVRPSVIVKELTNNDDFFLVHNSPNREPKMVVGRIVPVCLFKDRFTVSRDGYIGIVVSYVLVRFIGILFLVSSVFRDKPHRPSE